MGDSGWSDVSLAALAVQMALDRTLAGKPLDGDLTLVAVSILAPSLLVLTSWTGVLRRRRN